MGYLTRVLEKSGYAIDLDDFQESSVEVTFELVEEATEMTEKTALSGTQSIDRGRVED